ncbi:hypothetical protein BDY19DRAFT_995676 [Irpex rosettiformis]|uniref:Uncharacterized protein n=1 Tax=Irpex rosettiformis TaxID=378272 RepID=A0ACB8TX56_9APHY|nr:hypothetical protein BDY19DRAFT_995676 [Irpex rosettiformis]
MDLPTIGAHCALDACNINDFLPIRCRCDKLFCKDHISPETHACPTLIQTKDKPTISTPQQKLQRCAADKCNKPSLEAFVADSSDTNGRTPAVCERCKQSFCASHRSPASHSCTAPDPHLPPPRNEAAKAILAQIFPTRSSSSSSNTSSAVPVKRKAAVPANPRKAAQLRQVELMKMRHRAQPADPRDQNRNVPIGERLHVKISAENKDEEKLFWFQKTMATGKALDILAAHLEMSSNKAPLYLCRDNGSEQEGDSVLQNDKLLADQIEDGSSLILRH